MPVWGKAKPIWVPTRWPCPGHARRILFLEDGDMAVIRAGSVSVLDRSGKPADRPAVPAETSHVLAEKGNHRHFMEKGNP